MKSRRKKQLARLNKQQAVQGITLQQAWDRVCEELDQRNECIWFVDTTSFGSNGEWSIHSAGNHALAKQSGGKN